MPRKGSTSTTPMTKSVPASIAQTQFGQVIARASENRERLLITRKGEAASVILVVGFGLFLLSGFRINSSMGAMISLSIAFALAFDFLCLPGLLMKFDKKTANEG